MILSSDTESIGLVGQFWWSVKLPTTYARNMGMWGLPSFHGFQCGQEEGWQSGKVLTGLTVMVK